LVQFDRNAEGDGDVVGTKRREESEWLTKIKSRHIRSMGGDGGTVMKDRGRGTWEIFLNQFNQTLGLLISHHHTDTIIDKTSQPTIAYYRNTQKDKARVHDQMVVIVVKRKCMGGMHGGWMTNLLSICK